MSALALSSWLPASAAAGCAEGCGAAAAIDDCLGGGGGKTLLTFTEDPEALALCAQALVAVIRRGAADKMAVEKVNGAPVLDTELARALAGAGFYSTPRGLRFRS